MGKEQEEGSGSRLTYDDCNIMLRNVNPPPGNESKSENGEDIRDVPVLNIMFIPKPHSLCGATLSGLCFHPTHHHM